MQLLSPVFFPILLAHNEISQPLEVMDEAKREVLTVKTV